MIALASFTSVLSGAAPFGISEAGWIAASAIATALAAFAAIAAAAVTSLMAIYTRKLASETHALSTETESMVKASGEERTQLEIHHQRSMTPLVVVVAKCERMSVTELRFRGFINNIGPGPALALYIAIKPDVSVVAEKYLGALQAGAVWNFNLHWNVSATTPRLEAYPYECFIAFTSIFARDGYTRQRSYSGLGEDASLREMILPADCKPGEVAAAKDTFRGSQALAAFGEMSPRAV